jgi:hypothetical protein
LFGFIQQVILNGFCKFKSRIGFNEFRLIFFWKGFCCERSSNNGKLTGHGFAEWSLKDFTARIALGTAIPDSVELAGAPTSLPLTELEGKQDLQRDAEFIGHANQIRGWFNFAQENHSGVEWAEKLAEMIKSFMPESRAYQEERAKMESSLAKLIDQANQGPKDQIPLALFSAQALPCLDLDHGKGQFMSGGVVVAPLRSSCVHPAKIIALVGMNDGAYPARGTRPGPEINAGNKTQTKREAYQREQRGMHAVLLAIGAAQEKLIVTFQGYAGASGKEASAALPVEMLRLGCEAITKGHDPEFKVRRHGIMSHEKGHESDNDVPVTKTYDKAGALVAGTIAKDIQPNEIIALSEKTTQHWTLEQWLSFWTDPVKETFKAYDAKAIWLENPPLESEPLSGTKSTVTDRTKQKWIDSYFQRTGQKPKWEEAGIISGLFADDPSTKLKFDELVGNADDGQPGPPYEWDKVIERILEIKGLTPMESLKCRYVEVAYSYKDWAFVCLPEQVDIDKLTPFVALNLLATAQAENPKIRHLALSKQSTTTSAKSGVQTHGMKSRFVSTEKSEGKDMVSLQQKLITLSQSCISNEHMLSSGVFELAFKHVMSGDNKPLDEKALFGDGFGGGESSDSHAKLLMPPRFNFNKPIDAIKTHFADYRWHHNLGGGNKAIRIKLGTELAK